MSATSTLLKTLTILLAATAPLAAQVPEGIPRELARQRAQQISDVRYSRTFDLTPHATEANGVEELKFRLAHPVPVLLDFREGKVAGVEINGKRMPAKIENGHIALPQQFLRAGENTV